MHQPPCCTLHDCKGDPLRGKAKAKLTPTPTPNPKHENEIQKVGRRGLSCYIRMVISENHPIWKPQNVTAYPHEISFQYKLCIISSSSSSKFRISTFLFSELKSALKHGSRKSSIALLVADASTIFNNSLQSQLCDSLFPGAAIPWTVIR